MTKTTTKKTVLRRIGRIVAYIAAGLAGLVVLISIALAFLIGTQGGTRFLFKRLDALMPGSFDVQSVDGRIDSPLTLHGVVYKKPGMEIRIDRLYLEWRLMALLSRRVDVGRLYADGVTILQTPQPSQQPSPLPDLDLHFNILVRDARVRGMTLGSGAPPAAGQPPAAPMVIDEIDLKTTDIANHVHVDELAVRSPLLTADVNGNLQPQGDYPVDLNLHWTFRPPATPARPATPATPARAATATTPATPAIAATAATPAEPAMPPFSGSGRLHGTLKSLQVDQVLTAPFAVKLSALLTDPMRDLQFDGRVAFDGVNPRHLRPDLPDLPASGMVSAKGSLDKFYSSGSVAGEMAPAGRFAVAYQVSRQGDSWQIQKADITLPGTPTRLALQGKVTLPSTPAAPAGVPPGGSPAAVSSPPPAPTVAGTASGALDADLQASWQSLAWPPRGTASFASPSGKAHIVAHMVTPPAGAAGTAGTTGATASGNAQPAASLSSQGSVDAVVATLGAVAVDYRLSRQGDTWHLERLNLTSPGRPTQLSASGQVVQHGQDLDIDAALNWHGLAWPLNGKPEVTSSQGEARVAGSLDHFKAEVSAQFAGGNGTARAAARPAVGTAVNAAGSANPGAVVAANGAVVAPAAGGALGAGTTTGGIADLPPGRFSVAGKGGRDSFHIDTLTADVLSGHLQGHGDVAWSPRVRWNLTLAAQNIDPSPLRPDMPGKLGFDVATRGESAPSGLSGNVDLPRLQGTLRGQPVSVSAAVRLAGAEYDIAHLDAHWGTARLQASGRAGDRLDLTFDTSAPNLGLLLPAATGGVKAQGHVTGPMKAPRVQATVQADGVRYGTQSVANGNLKADVDLAAGGPFQLDAELRDLNAGGQLLSKVTVQTRGTTASHTLALSVVGLADRKDARFDLGLSGGVRGPLAATSAWNGQITRLDVRSSPIGDWSLERAATLDASAKAVELRGLCWQAKAAPAPADGKSAPPASGGGNGVGGELCASGAWAEAGTWAGEMKLTALPLSLAKPFLPPDLTIRGEVNGTATAHGGSKGIAAADIDISPGPGDLRFPVEGGRSANVHFDRGTVRAQAGPAGGNATIALALQNIGTFNVQLRLPRLTQGLVLKEQPLSGTVTAHVHDISFLEGFVPDLRKVGGAFDADLTLAGTAGAPRIAGKAVLAGGRAQVPLYGLDLQDIKLTATGDGGGLAIDAGARSGPGSVRLAGRASLAPSPTAPVHLTLTGSRFAVMNTRDIRILVTPDIKLDYQGTDARVTGQVTVPEAHIHIDKQAKAGPVQPSKDVVFVGGAKPLAQPASPPLALHASLRLIVPNPAIELDALGLKGIPYGTLLITEEPGRPTGGSGEMDIAPGGTFQAYGQNLTIEHGRLIFGGPIDNPGLDIRASRLSDDQTVTAGIDAKGTLKLPEISVWSNPAMAQSDALAYVLLGHGLNSANQQEGNRVANAATSLGLSGAGMLAKNLGARFGLEEASIQSSGGLDQASLMLGKYLAPHLYVVYGIGLFQPVSTFRVRYILSSKWTLQAESSTETGADILYTLERGKTR